MSVNNPYKTVYQAEKAGKKILAHGTGVGEMLRKSKAKGLTCSNSLLIVKDTGDLRSEWWLVEK